MWEGLWIATAVIAALVVIAALTLGLVLYRRRRISLSPRPERGVVDRSGGYTASSGITFSQTPTTQPAERIDTSGLPAVGDDATVPRDAPKRTIADVHLPEFEPEPQAPEVPEADAIAPPEGRLERLRGRLARSQNALGRGLLGLIGGGDLDEDSWQDVEDTLLVADLGPAATASVLRPHGQVLVFWDCYRPHDVQVRMFDVVPNPAWVARPGKYAHSHEAGRSVDVTFASAQRQCPSVRRSGELCLADMGTDFDDFSSRATAFATQGVSAEAQANRAHLRAAMQAGGLTVYSGEWWHFDGPGAGVDRPILEVPVD